MTQKEIDKFLANTKVYVNGKSKEIQEKLFLLGYNWPGENSTKVIHEGAPFLYIDNNHRISYGSDMVNFSNYKNREITAEEILAIELTNPTYRPFKSKEECWQEMLKHQPFGWINDKYCNIYKNITVVYNEKVELTPYFNYNGDNLQNIILYKDIIKKYTFADGTPFGVKED